MVFFFQCFFFSSFAVFYLWFSASMLLLFSVTKAFCLYSHIKSLVAERDVGETWPHLSKRPLWSESLWASLFVICVETMCLLALTYSDTVALSSLTQMCVFTCQWVCQDSWPPAHTSLKGQIWYCVCFKVNLAKNIVWFSFVFPMMQWEPVQYFNNKIICDLVEEKFKGIISILVRRRHRGVQNCWINQKKSAYFKRTCD